MAKPIVNEEVVTRVYGSTQQEKKEFGQRLYRAMLQKGMTQSELAKATGLDRMRISSYIRGQSLPRSVDYLKRIAAVLSVKPEDLLPSKIEGEQPLYSTAVSPDGKQMRITADVWVPVAVGAQIVQLLADAALDRD